MGFRFRILYQDAFLVVIDKPSRFHVHPPENGFAVPRRLTCLYRLRDQLGQYLYPVHRLDVPTSGCLLFALDKDTARAMQEQITTHTMTKTYQAWVRGWFPKDKVSVDIPLLNEQSIEQPALTQFESLQHFEIAVPNGKRFQTTRFSLITARPVTGRFHQIRRHLNRLAHPIFGDREHGDSHCNRWMREVLGTSGLLLRATELTFRHPNTSEMITVQAPVSARWLRLQDRVMNHPARLSLNKGIFNSCP